MDAGTSSSESSGASVQTAGSPDYIGPELAFDVPEGWHEFYLDSGWDFFAAYGPENGSGSDYVAVGPVPPESGANSSEELLQRLVPSSSDPTDVEVTQGNGLTMYTALWRNDDLTQQTTVVEGLQDTYLVTCQYGLAMDADVSGGCASILASLSVAEPSPIVEPSGCTQRELTLLEGVPVWGGATPGLPASAPSQGCDVMVEMPPGSTEDIIRYYEGVLKDEGWLTRNRGVVRTGPTGDVVQLLAIQDWDGVLIEAYVDDGATDIYFITATDG